MARSSLASFLRLARPKFLVGGFLGFALGALAAHSEGAVLSWQAYVQGQLLVTAFHAMVHFANDYFDRETDELTTRTPWSGGSGALVDGSLAPIVALRAALVCASVGAALVALSLGGGHAIVGVVGVGIGVLAWGYSAPPLRFSARGWGELDTALVVAMLVPIAGFATFTGFIDLRMVATTLPGAVAMIVMMLCVEVPDLGADAQTDKRNLVVRLGPQRSRALIAASVAAAFVAVALAIVLGATPALGLTALIALPFAIFVMVQLRERPFGLASSGARLAFSGVAFFVATSVGSVLAVALA